MNTVLICLIVGAVLFLLLLSGLIYPHFPVVETYEIESEKLKEGQRVALLTDLHGCHHGKNNKKLIRMLRELAPTMIVIAGDMTVKDGSGMDTVIALMEALTPDFPVYYAPGNHEIRMPNYDELQRRLAQTGVVFLSNKAVTLPGGVTVYGLDLPEYWYHKMWQKRDLTEDDIKACLGACDGETFSLVLAHNPEYFSAYAKWGADLTLSGHVHGGILRLPLLGGVIAPSLRLFPTYDAGLFQKGKKSMVVSRGLGLHHIKLRFFNRPELSVINLTCKPIGK